MRQVQCVHAVLGNALSNAIRGELIMRKVRHPGRQEQTHHRVP